MKNIKNKDWIGNNHSVFITHGASNHCDKEREKNDYYATDPKAIKLLMEKESFSNNIWECAVGEGHLAEYLINNGYSVKCSDIVDRGFINTEVLDFLTYGEKWNGDIITNPPYKYALDFVKKSIEVIPNGNKVAMFLKLTFLEGKARRKFFDEYPPKIIYVCSGRIDCAKNGDFKAMKDGGGTALAYAWYVWEKGFKGDSVVKWIN